MIRVCSNCSNVDVDLLTEVFGEDKVEVNCLGQCGMNPDESFGYVNEEFIIVDSEEAFIKAVKENL
jgi:uncharacterized protein YuzB (UPF0349 family)